VTDAVQVANAAYQRDGGLAGLSTGLSDLDRKLGGLHRSDLLILAGRPSMGKTSLATNIAFNIAKAYRRGRKTDGTEGAVNGGVVGFFSLEMSAEQLAARVLSEAAEVPSEQIRRGDMTETEFRRFVDAAKTLESARSSSTTRRRCRSASSPPARGGSSARMGSTRSSSTTSSS
jgi:replicative DNA helicase